MAANTTAEPPTDPMTDTPKPHDSPDPRHDSDAASYRAGYGAGADDYDGPDVGDEALEDELEDELDGESAAPPRKRHPGAVRSTDLEPYTGLRWVSTLFKAAAVFVFVALAAEFVAGLRMGGAAAIPALLGETAQTVVLAVVLWGGGDLVRLLVDMGHDFRAQRILMVRLLSRTPKRTMPDGRPDRTVDEEAEELNVHAADPGPPNAA